MLQSKKSSSYDLNRFKDLIRFCRNLCEHYQEIAQESPKVKPIIGSTLEDAVRFCIKSFPWLMIVVQIIVDDYAS